MEATNKFKLPNREKEKFKKNKFQIFWSYQSMKKLNYLDKFTEKKEQCKKKLLFLRKKTYLWKKNLLCETHTLKCHLPTQPMLD
jgi:hypothetical protein